MMLIMHVSHPYPPPNATRAIARVNELVYDLSIYIIYLINFAFVYIYSPEKRLSS